MHIFIYTNYSKIYDTVQFIPAHYMQKYQTMRERNCVVHNVQNNLKIITKTEHQIHQKSSHLQRSFGYCNKPEINGRIAMNIGVMGLDVTYSHYMRMPCCALRSAQLTSFAPATCAKQEYLH